jgi:AraC family transcriptional regulator
MRTTAPLQPKPEHLPILSSQNQGWENILVEQFQPPPGECSTYYNNDHTICLSLSPRPIRLFQVKDGRSYTSLYGKGDMSLTPAQMPFSARWEAQDNYLQIRIASQFIQQVAREALDQNPDQMEFLPEFRMRDSHIEAITLMLLKELQQDNSGSRLYIESLANVLAVHLIRQYSAAKPGLPAYEGGLSQHQLRQVLDYVHDALDQDIKLADLAALLNMSQFHFSHQFKQAIGTSPYQYLLQQRVERAKQLLQQTERSIIDIALACGFNSHSHLSKQFRQLTGTTPRQYRGK